MKTTICIASVLLLLGPSLSFGGIVAGPFGPFGEGGFVNGQSFTFGTTGEVFEIDSFINIAGSDLNGGALGTSGQLSVDPLPAGLEFSFSSALSADMTDITLTYSFNNLTGDVINGFQFFPFVDAEIDALNNTYFDELGSVGGVAGSGAGDPDPDSWEIDEPGYVIGDIFDNLLLGVLDNMNAFAGTPEDVAMALGFDLGLVRPFQVATIEILLSDDGDSIGSLFLTQSDDGGSPDTLTLSGGAQVQTVPEPSSCLLWLVTGTACIAVARRRRKAAAKTE